MNNETTTIAEQLKKGQTVISFTKGVSMRPLLYEGKSFVVIKPIEKPLALGDLPIWLRDDGKYVLHRIVKITDDFIYTRGDNCISCEKNPHSKMLGVVVLINRMGKEIPVTDSKYLSYVNFWMKTAPVRIFLKRIRLKLSKVKHEIFKG